MLRYSKIFPKTDFINKSVTVLPDYTLKVLPSSAPTTFNNVVPVTEGITLNPIYPTNYLTYAIGSDDSVVVVNYSDLSKLNAPLVHNSHLDALSVSLYYGEYSNLLLGLGCKYSHLFDISYDVSTCIFNVSGANQKFATQIAGTTSTMVDPNTVKVWRLSLTPSELDSLATYKGTNKYSDGTSTDNGIYIGFMDAGKSHYTPTTNVNLYTYGVDGSPVASNKLPEMVTQQFNNRLTMVNILYHPFKWLWSKARPDNTFAKVTTDTTISGVTTTTSGINLGPVAVNTPVSSTLQIRNIDAVETFGTLSVNNWGTITNYPTIEPPVKTTYAITSIVVSLQTSLGGLSASAKNSLVSEFSLSYTYKGTTVAIGAFTATATTVTVPVSLTMACLDEVVFNVTYTPKLKLVATNSTQFAIPYVLAAATSAATATNSKRGVKIQLKGYPTGTTGGGVPDTVLSGTTSVALGDAMSVVGTVL